MFHSDVIYLGKLDIRIYQCITDEIDTDDVIVSEKQLLHIADHHPDSYPETLIQLKSTIKDPDYIFLDERRKDTGLVAKKISLSGEILYIVLRVCTDSENGTLANSVISGWKISESRLQNYIRHKQILYKKAQNK